MSEKPSLSKNTGSSASPAASKTPPPRLILLAAGSLALSGVMAVLASLSLLAGSVKSWIRDNARDSFADDAVDKIDDIRKAKPSTGISGTSLDQLQTQLRELKKTASDAITAKLQPLYDNVAQLKTGAKGKGPDLLDDIKGRLDDLKGIEDQLTAAQKATLISSVVVFVALGIAAGAVFKGRYWSRWVVIGLWVLATFTQSIAGISSVLGIVGDIPLLFKVPSFLSGLALVAAVVLVNMRPSVDFLNRSRPTRPTAAGGAARRGLFSPRPPATSRTTTPAAKPTSSADRARTKQRASSDAAAAAKGAELARSRAKAANKSRRSGS